jgi:hypothetical protein
MKYREIEIFAPKDLGAAGVEVIDLDMVDCLSALFIQMDITVATVSDMTASLPSTISKIEIVDGSDVLFSLSGERVQALCFYTMGYMPHNYLSVVAADHMRFMLPIYFGRKLYDPEYAFDPSRFKSPQLKITWDEDAASASVVVNELTVRGVAFDEKSIVPTGFLMSKDIKTFTPVASSYEYTELPRDYPYRALLLQASSTDKNPFEVINQIKLSEDHDKRVPYDLTGYELFRFYNQAKGKLVEKVRLNETAGDAMALYLASSYLQDGVMQLDADVVAASDDFTQPTYAHNIVTIAATVNYVPYALLLTGYAPYGCMCLNFGDLMDFNDLYDVMSLGHLRLIYQGAAAVGTSPSTTIFAQQLRMY